jgi:hypothetical protein
MNRTLTRAVLGLAAALALAAAPALTATAASAATAWHGGGYTCTGGNIPAGTYISVKVTGLCTMDDGLVTVLGDVRVGKGALLDAAATLGDPAKGTHVVPATVDIRGNVFVGKGAVLVLGCSPNFLGICMKGSTFDTIGGNLTARGALADVVHNTDIRGNVSVRGGGGGLTCNPLAPWSQDPALAATFTPQFTDFEDGAVGGNLSVTHVTTCWIGTLRELAGGNVTYAGDTTADPDGMEIDNNLVRGNLDCFHNSPAIQFGDSQATSNIVGGNASGECGFGVLLANPAPEADEGTGIMMHVSVPSYSLPVTTGTRTTTFVANAFPSVTTDAGNTITGVANNFALAGRGLTGSGTFDPSIGPPNSGDAVLTVTKPDHFGQFIAYDACNPCSLGGKSGIALLRFYGTVLPSGQVYGTFLVTSGGNAPLQPGSLDPGGFATLTGYGTFYGNSPTSPWCLVEHLKIT